MKTEETTELDRILGRLYAWRNEKPDGRAFLTFVYEKDRVGGEHGVRLSGSLNDMYSCVAEAWAQEQAVANIIEMALMKITSELRARLEIQKPSE